MIDLADGKKDDGERRVYLVMKEKGIEMNETTFELTISFSFETPSKDTIRNSRRARSRMD